MRQRFLLFGLICFITLQMSCTKFLEVKPIDKFSGEEFWRNEDDAQKAVNSCYALLYNKMNASPLYNGPDIRPGNWNLGVKYNFIAFATNKLNSPDLDDQDAFADPRSSWKTFYECIASCNLCIDKIPQIEDGAFSEKDRKSLIAEARFVRNFVYFEMVRLYGDVPLHNDPYATQNVPRMDMVSLLDTCIADLQLAAPDLPVAFPDPTYRAVKATKGAAYTLMANIYMWQAGFDKKNQQKYWKGAVEATKEVIDLGIYQLIPYDETTSMSLFKGRSEEGIFEISMNANYGNTGTRIIGQWTLHRPVLPTSTTNYGGLGSEMVYTKDFLDKLFPPGQADKRFTLWFDDPYCTLNPMSAMMTKFMPIDGERNFDNNYIIFRYGGLLLLRAEALARLGGHDKEAITLLNQIRNRAGAQVYSGSGGPALVNAIFIEREKELICEGHRWYDLVRTGKVLDASACENHLSKADFDQGAWTWPIPSSAIKSNPMITQNLYWNK